MTRSSTPFFLYIYSIDIFTVLFNHKSKIKKHLGEKPNTKYTKKKLQFRINVQSNFVKID